ncbi:MAG TPA: hypothetical protein VMT35_16405 [Ignavibacteriaceae bacterium]|nr:hypothetical protein [Ignavibacteriaceae bacterium]
MKLKELQVYQLSIEEKDYLKFASELEVIGVKLNNYIKTIGRSSNNSKNKE